MNHFRFQNPTELIFGDGTLEHLSLLLNKYGGKKILLVYGGGSIKQSGIYNRVVNQLKQGEFELFELAGVEANPRLSTVYKGIEMCRSAGIDFVLAIGGGSVIDASKAIAMGVPYEGDVWDFYLYRAQAKSALPLGVILTHAASGSEANGMSVITHWEQKRKQGMESIYAFPKFAILDPTLTYTVPRQYISFGIVDMMSHVFEQYFSQTTNTPLQERMCESLLRTMIENGPKALESPHCYEARSNLMLCATMAFFGGLNGLISMGVQGDWATHLIEHELSAIYDIPHAAGIAILFPNWMKYVYRERMDRFVQFAVQVWQVDPTGKSDESIALEGIDKTREFFNRLGVPKRLAEVDIDEDAVEVVAKRILQSYGTVGQFKKLHEDDVKEILRMSL